MSVLPRLQVISCEAMQTVAATIYLSFMWESCNPPLPLPFKMQVYSGTQSWLQLVFKHNSQEVSQHSYPKSGALRFLQALHQQHRGVDSSWTSSSCACNSHSEEPAPKDVREHQRCQQAPASTFPFKPLLSTSYFLSICLCTPKKKGGKMCFIFCSYHM